MLSIGQAIPAIEVEALTPQGEYRAINFSDHRYRWKVLFFWQWDFTITCLARIRAYHALTRQFAETGAILFGASVDSVYAHRAWTTNGLGKVDFPLIGDATRQLTSGCGVLSQQEGMAEYATFIIEPGGHVAGVVTHSINVAAERGVQDALRMLWRLQADRGGVHQCHTLSYDQVA